MPGGRFIGEPKVANHLVKNVSRGWTDAAIVEVDDGTISLECALDLGPVIFIGRELAGRSLAGRFVGTGRTGKRIGANDEPTRPATPAPVRNERRVDMVYLSRR